MAAFDALPAGCLRFDDQRIIVDANPEAARLLQYTRDELIGRRLSGCLPVASRIFFQAHVFPELAEQGRLDEVYVSLQTSARTELPVLMSARRAEAGEGYWCVFLPMQRRQVVERDLIHSREEADRASQAEQLALSQVREIQAHLVIQDRLASIGTLAAGVAHEINNPLTFVAGNLEWLAQRLRPTDGAAPPLDPQELAALLDETRDGVDRIRSIVKSLRSLSRGEKEAIGPVSLAEACATARRLCAHELTARARVTVDLPSPPLVVMADEGRLVQVFVNLLVNAAHAMPDRLAAENRIVVRGRLLEGGHVRIEVEDNGRGMPADVQSRIFEPFFTTKVAGVGTGLGLAVCRGIIVSLGGTIEVASLEGEGTAFRIVLPMAPEAPPRSVEAGGVAPAATPERGLDASATPEARGEGRTRILIVDDEAFVVRTMTRMLRAHEVTAAADGRDAVERIRAGECFDVMFCDLMMPGMSGMEVYDAVLAAAPEQARRIVFMTGGTFTESVTTFLGRVPNVRIEKPFSLGSLRDACTHVLDAAGPCGA
ncbi:MAG: ATP-binding protein [Vicinamibacterales bacterium]